MSDISTQERIKVAAAKVFTLKGMEGARMQDIADEANINKAMLHYYYKNKQSLFEIIFQDKVTKIFSAFGGLLRAEISFEDKIRQFVLHQIDIISEFPVMPLFVLLEARKNPELLVQNFKDIPLLQIRLEFTKLLNNEIEKGNIRPIKMEELLINLMSMCVYPIVAEPMLKFVFDLNQEQYQVMIQQRKKIVADLLISDLKPKALLQ